MVLAVQPDLNRGSLSVVRQGGGTPLQGTFEDPVLAGRSRPREKFVERFRNRRRVRYGLHLRLVRDDGEAKGDFGNGFKFFDGRRR